MKKTFAIKFLLCAAAFSTVFVSCEKVKVAKSSESSMLTFKFDEYPDQKVDFAGASIFVQMPEEVSDLNLTAIFTISDKATATPASGVKKDFGGNVGFTIVSEDNLYLSTYYVFVMYPNSRVDLGSVKLPAKGYTYGDEFKFPYSKLPSAASPWGKIKWKGFAMSDLKGANLENPPKDVTPYQFYPAQDSGLGNFALASPGYGEENAVEISFDRPVNPDTLTIVPSALTVYCMKNVYRNDRGDSIRPMNNAYGDYMTLVLKGYDADGKLVGTKEVPIADFTYAGREYIRDYWQKVFLKSTTMKNIRSLKMYVKGAREEFYPVFAIDKLAYQIQAQLTPETED